MGNNKRTLAACIKFHKKNKSQVLQINFSWLTSKTNQQWRKLKLPIRNDSYMDKKIVQPQKTFKTLQAWISQQNLGCSEENKKKTESTRWLIIWKSCQKKFLHKGICQLATGTLRFLVHWHLDKLDQCRKVWPYYTNWGDDLGFL